MEYTPEKIVNLQPNEIFVFGSNTSGQHHGGAAKIAYEKFGAKWGMSEGLSGQTYAIPTIDFNTWKPVKRSFLLKCIRRFLRIVYQNPENKFYLTKIGCGIAGWSIEEIREILQDALEEYDGIVLDNLILPKEFSK
jgi:hypothetical protein